MYRIKILVPLLLLILLNVGLVLSEPGSGHELNGVTDRTSHLKSQNSLNAIQQTSQAFGPLLNAHSQEEQSGVPVQTRPDVIYEDYHDTSLPLRDMVLPAQANVGAPQVIPWHPRPGLPFISSEPDSVLQDSATGGPSVGPLVGTANLFSFGGISNRDNTAPPDTNASVGATQIIETVNTSYQVFTKTGVSLLGPRETSSIWSGFGGVCASGPAFGDPVVLYDKAAGRWLISQFASSDPFPHNTGTQCIAVSTSSDATGAYNRYAFSFSSFNDSTKFGVWPDAYYASYDMFTAVSFITEQVCAYDRSAMLAGTPAMTVCFQNSSDFAFLPSDLDGSTPPLAGEPNFFLELASSSSLKLFKFHVDFTTPSATFTGPIGIPVAPYSQACGGGTCIPQAGTSQQLDAKGDRLMHRLAYRNFGDHESLVVTHSVDAGSRVGVRWYEIRSPNGVPTVYQQGTYAPDSNYRWVGSIAMDGSGNIALGYSVSSSGMFPAIRFTGRVSSDPLGTMEAENVIIAGGGSQQGCPVDAQRWGDYTSMAIDPSDDATFVYANEYYRSTGCNWSTRIASFKITACRFHVYHLRTDQHVQELCGDGSTWQTQDLTTLTGALVAAAGSALSTFVDGAGGFHVYYLGTDQHVRELFFFNGAWTTSDDTAAAGAPNAAAGSALTSFVP